jgi:hypothetical protein
MGFLNLLRLAKPIDWNRGRLCNSAVVRSVNSEPERHNDELNEYWRKRKQQAWEVVWFLPTSAPPARSDARVQHVAVQFRAGLESRLQSTETTRERLAIKVEGPYQISGNVVLKSREIKQSHNTK